MSKKLLIVGVVSLVLVLIAAGLWWFTRPTPGTAVPPGGSPTATPPAGSEPGQIVPPAPASGIATPPQEVAVISLKSLASHFAEGYGSFSTDVNFQNLKDLDYLYTSTFRQSVQASIREAQPPVGFYGVTTRALTATIESQSDAAVTVVVATQRQELFSRTGEPQLRYQNLRLTFVREGERWLVDGAEWQ